MTENRYISLDDIALSFAKYGVKLDNVDNGNIPNLTPVTIFISVPSKSHLTLEDGEEASGSNLAKFIKTILVDHVEETTRRHYSDRNEDVDNDLLSIALDITRLKVKYKMREEEWTLRKEEEATLGCLESCIIKAWKEKSKV